MDIEKIKAETEENLNKSKKILFCIFFACVFVLLSLVWNAPVVNSKDKEIFSTFPKTVQQVQMLSDAILNYTKTSY
jgi:hypothetical protein